MAKIHMAANRHYTKCGKDAERHYLMEITRNRTKVTCKKCLNVRGRKI